MGRRQKVADPLPAEKRQPEVPTFAVISDPFCKGPVRPIVIDESKLGKTNGHH